MSAAAVSVPAARASGPRPAASSPWSARQRLVLAGLLALGGVGLAAGYAGVSGTLRVSHQVVWVNLAGAALLVSGAGIVVFLTAGRQAVGRRRLGLFGDVAGPGAAVAADRAAPAPPGSSAAGASGPAGPSSAPSPSADLVSAPTMTRYHRADCSFAAGKPGLVAASAAGHQEAGRRPCGACLAEGEA